MASFSNINSGSSTTINVTFTENENTTNSPGLSDFINADELINDCPAENENTTNSPSLSDYINADELINDCPAENELPLQDAGPHDSPNVIGADGSQGPNLKKQRIRMTHKNKVILSGIQKILGHSRPNQTLDWVFQRCWKDVEEEFHKKNQASEENLKAFNMIKEMTNSKRQKNKRAASGIRIRSPPGEI